MHPTLRQTVMRPAWAVTAKRLTARGSFGNARQAQVMSAMRRAAPALPALDFWHMLNAETEAQAALNWMQPAYDLTKVDAPVFTAGRGYKGDGVNDALTTGLIPSSAVGVKYARDTASMGVMVLEPWVSGTRVHAGSQGTHSTFVGQSTASTMLLALNAAGSIASLLTTFIGLVTLVRRNSANIDVYVGKVKVASAAANASSGLPTGAFRYLASSSASFALQTVAGGFLGRELTDDQVTALADAIHQDMIATGGYLYTSGITCIGNSLTNGNGTVTPATDSYPAQMQVLYGASITVNRQGFAGETGAQIIVRMGSTVALRAAAQLPANRRVAVIWELRNSIVVDAASAVVAVDKVEEICRLARAQGYDKILVCNAIADGSSGGMSGAAQAAVNAELSSRYANFSDGLVNLAARSELSTPTNATYYNADKLHLVTAGYAIVAAVVKAAIDAL